MTKKPGALRGNLNALKHGYYSRLFRSSEHDELPDDLSNLEHEIKLLRVMMRRTMQLADGIQDLKEAIRALDALGAAASRLASLLRTQKHLMGDRSPAADEISDAIQQINSEFRRNI